MKTCFKCLCEKPLEAFYRHSAMADGHLNKCKDCTKSDVKRHRQENWQKVREYDRMRASRPERVAKAKEIHKRWKAKWPARRRAQLLLGSAVKSGKVTPWPVCAMPLCSDKPEAHHPDYSRPLDVVWLCPAHHRQAHALVANDSQSREAA